MSEKNLIIIDDHKMIIEGITSLLSRVSDWSVSFSAQSEEETLSIINTRYGENYKFENRELFAIVDLQLGNETSFDLINELSNRGIKCIVYSVHNSPTFILKAMKNGADGYVLKGQNESEITKALDCVWSGGQYFSANQLKTVSHTLKVISIFTKREAEVFELTLEGLSIPEIANKMKLSRRTIENHFSQIYAKTQCSSRDDLRSKYGTMQNDVNPADSMHIYGGGYNRWQLFYGLHVATSSSHFQDIESSRHHHPSKHRAHS